jgi:Protein of unknown function (DUF2905)
MVQIEAPAATADPIRDGARQAMRRWVIAIGLALVVVGLLWPWLGKLGLGRLPGDIVVERGGVRLSFPIVTCLVISAIVSLILWLLNR